MMLILMLKKPLHRITEIILFTGFLFRIFHLHTWKHFNQAENRISSRIRLHFQFDNFGRHNHLPTQS